MFKGFFRAVFLPALAAGSLLPIGCDRMTVHGTPIHPDTVPIVVHPIITKVWNTPAGDFAPLLVGNRWTYLIRDTAEGTL